MFEWVTRDVWIDVSINVVPLVVMAVFVVVLAVWTPWSREPLVRALTLGLMVVPILALAVATYYVSLAVERDARGA